MKHFFFFDCDNDCEKCYLLLQFTLNCLCKIFLFDTQHFISKQRAEALMLPLVDQETTWLTWARTPSRCGLMKCGRVSTTFCRAARALSRWTSPGTSSLLFFTVVSSDGIRLDIKNKSFRVTLRTENGGSHDAKMQTIVPLTSCYVTAYKTLSTHFMGLTARNLPVPIVTHFK